MICELCYSLPDGDLSVMRRSRAVRCEGMRDEKADDRGGNQKAEHGARRHKRTPYSHGRSPRHRHCRSRLRGDCRLAVARRRRDVRPQARNLLKQPVALDRRLRTFGVLLVVSTENS